jgi:GNAT superfamily N-acetyltransferase
VVGGLLGGIWGGVLYVRILWVAQALRGRGHGRRLLEAAERRAVERGCHRVYLDTFSFQAPGFYEKQGYEIYARADDWPVGHAHYFLRKSIGVA